ncbi:FixH family protein [Bacillus xiapuensis]|uniref:FixH family protein n=1 Tax=Bacillus xiapuensis TaxID=2014075 RepID=A0ABU6NDR0_9BACI|nr:FixH family protein [Bacillus xiapuensis]
MKKFFIGFVVLIGLLAGCSDQSGLNTSNSSDTPQEVKVAIKFVPETITANQNAKIEAIVTQGKEKVSDADEVKFEIWKSGQDKHEMLNAKNEGKGIYSITKTFKDEGQYYVTAHVTARDMHTMPNQKFTVEK